MGVTCCRPKMWTKILCLAQTKKKSLKMKTLPNWTPSRVLPRLLITLWLSVRVIYNTDQHILYNIYRFYWYFCRFEDGFNAISDASSMEYLIAQHLGGKKVEFFCCMMRNEKSTKIRDSKCIEKNYLHLKTCYWAAFCSRLDAYAMLCAGKEINKAT